MEPFSIEESTTLTGARIVAVGVGGGGGNMIGYMLKEAIPGIELIIANTDAQVLEHGSAATKIQLGAKLTKGLGAGMKPEVGKESALESYEDLSRALEGADIVFVAAGLGGGTGTGAAPIIAKIAKEVGALTIAVVTKPFSFEGKKRLKLAEDGLNELKNESDCIVVIPNDKLLSIIDPKLGIKESFKIVDSVLARAVSGTSGVILASGDNDINLDFADLQTVMSHRGLALMGVGEYKGENAAYEAIKNAIESPLLDNMSVNGALGVLVHFSMHPEFPFMELSAA
ncbi:MAG: cell division protein FtsZ, partial [Sulfuricurvum sp. RIFCSPLOWO2_12_43_5]